MINPFAIPLALFSVVVLVVAKDMPRARLWIGSMAAAFAASGLYWDLGLPYHPAATAFCDALVCLTVYFFAREEWEAVLYRVFQGSVLISLLRLSGFIEDSTVYAIALEACNWLALIMIGGTALLDKVSAHGGISHRRWHGRILRISPSLRQARKEAPFTQAQK